VSLPLVLVDDEPAVLRSLETLLLSHGHTRTEAFADPREALKFLRAEPARLVLLDLSLPHLSGLDLLALLHEERPGLPVIVITARQEIETAVECMRRGAADYLLKPVETERLLSAIRKVFDLEELRAENELLREAAVRPGLRRPEAFAALLHNSPRMHAVFRMAEAVAPSSQPVLITGETGTGKELLARAIHAASGRPGRFVAVNAAGLDDTLFSDTLFGHVRGAFTGAERDRTGLAEEAAGGTLFLDEIGDLSAASQVKLLRFLQEREILPLGADRPRPCDARLVAATHRDLAALQADGRFRRDLFYRLRAHPLHLPPLRERPEDLAALVPALLAQAASDLGKPPPEVPPQLFPLLAAYPFPGNVRELRALLADALSRHERGPLPLAAFREAVRPSEPASPPPPAEGGVFAALPSLPPLKSIREQLVAEALRRAGGNQSLAASLLGVTRQAIGKYVKGGG